MPLILFTGYPCSSKSKWSLKLKNELESKIKNLKPGEQGYNYKVILHTDESLGINHEAYKDSNKEKSARGIQISVVKRDLSKNNIVILDSLNYIKGFRYQLHCESKALSTPYCLIHVISPSEICFKWNDEIVDGNDDNDHHHKWDNELIKNLIMRYEEPDSANRWDSPLIPISYDDTDLPFDEIWDSTVLKKGLKPNNATVLKPAISTNFLQELDKLTNYVINKILENNTYGGNGGEIKIENTVTVTSSSSQNKGKDFYIVNLPSHTISIAQLQRYRRSYVSLNRMRTVDIDRIIPLFVEYLNNNLNND
ncbi:hypothetical protein B5S32_g5662 [[Candida] boidinii]|nr:hypothetical protein B5S32_g5662 [[Candida] boidinii]